MRASGISLRPQCFGLAEAGMDHLLCRWPGCEEPQKGGKGLGWDCLDMCYLPATYGWLN